MKILLVEDERAIALISIRLLRETGAEVTWHADGLKGFAAAQQDDWDLIVLDILLPGMNGQEICRELRRKGYKTPVLMLSALDEVGDRVKGLENGADDYLSKPYEADELIARANALLRRSPRFEPESVKVEDLELDRKHRMAYRSGISIFLTDTEYDVLEELVTNEGRVISNEMIWSQISVYPADKPDTPEKVIENIRFKVDSNFEIKLVHEVPGFGYLVKAKAS